MKNLNYLMLGLTLLFLTACGSKINVSLPKIFGGGGHSGYNGAVESIHGSMVSSSSFFNEFKNNIEVSNENICEMLISSSIFQVLPPEDLMPIAPGYKQALADLGITSLNTTTGECAFNNTNLDALVSEIEALYLVSNVSGMHIQMFTAKTDSQKRKERLDRILSEYKGLGAEEKEELKANSGSLAEKIPSCVMEAPDLTGLPEPETMEEMLALYSLPVMQDFLYTAIICENLTLSDSSDKYMLIDHVVNQQTNKNDFTDLLTLDLIATTPPEKIQNFSSEKINGLVTKQAKLELLQVFVNVAIAEFSNIYQLMTFVGYESYEESGSTQDQSLDDILDDLQFDKSKLKNYYNEYKFKSVDSDSMVKKLLNPNKPKLYMLFEKILNDYAKIKIVNTHLVDEKNSPIAGYYDEYEYTFDVAAICAGSTDVNCIADMTDQVSRIKFIHNVKTKKVNAYYKDPTYLASSLKGQISLFEVTYSYDYKFRAHFDLENLKNIAIAYSERRLDGGLETKLQDLITIKEKKDIDYVKSVTAKGSFSGRFDLAVPRSAGDVVNSLLDVSKTTFNTEMKMSIDDEFKIVMPYSREEEYIKITDANNMINDGDVMLRIAPSANFVSFKHNRGNTIYDDIVSLNQTEINMQFPPYVLNAKDVLAFDIGINQRCDDANLSYETCNYQARLAKNTISKDLDRAYAHFKNQATANSAIEEYYFDVTSFDLKWLAPIKDREVTVVNAQGVSSTKTVQERSVDDTIKMSTVKGSVKAINEQTKSGRPGMFSGLEVSEGTEPTSKKYVFNDGSMDVGFGIGKEFILDVKSQKVKSENHINDMLLSAKIDMRNVHETQAGEILKINKCNIQIAKDYGNAQGIILAGTEVNYIELFTDTFDDLLLQRSPGAEYECP